MSLAHSKEADRPSNVTERVASSWITAELVPLLEVLGKPYKRSEIDRVQAALRRGARTGLERAISDFGPVRE